MSTTKKTTLENTAKPIILSGTVVKAAMQKTVVVSVDRLVKHPKYKKYHKVSKKYKVHDEEGKASVGDKVDIIETKPISKDKHFTLLTK